MSPIAKHFEMILAAASKGKIIFCEKLLTLALKDTSEMKEAVLKSGIFFHMGFMRRFDRGFASAKQRIEAGEYGVVIGFNASCSGMIRHGLIQGVPEMSCGGLSDMITPTFDI